MTADQKIKLSEISNDESTEAATKRVLCDVVQFVENVEMLEVKPEPELIREKSAKVSRVFHTY